MRRYRNPAALAVATLLAGACNAALAADPPADKPTGSKFDEMLDSAGLTVSGYIAASYSASNGYPFNIHQFDIEHNTFQLDQAGLQVAYQPKEGFGALVDVMAGEDVTLAGAEVINPTLNTNFSRSLLFFDSEPLTHTGIRATYALTGELT